MFGGDFLNGNEFMSNKALSLSASQEYVIVIN